MYFHHGHEAGKEAKTSAASSAPSILQKELIEPVLAILSMPQIVQLKRNFESWATMLLSVSSKRLCAAAHPNPFGLIGWNADKRDGMFDMKSNKWMTIGVTDFRKEHEYEDSMIACNGGLVCFVPRSGKQLAALPILVLNPLTNDRKVLPLPPSFGKRQLILVQLVKYDDKTQGYQVILVYGDKFGADSGAVSYDSRNGRWSEKTAGFVHGAGNTLLCGQRYPLVFYCKAKRLLNQDFSHEHSTGTPGTRFYALVEDQLFVLDDFSSTGTFILGEYKRQYLDIFRMGLLQTHSGTLSDLSGEEHNIPVLLPCSEFVLLTWDNDDYENHHQSFKLFDRASAEWHDLPTWVENLNSRITLVELERSLICDIRWDAIP